MVGGERTANNNKLVMILTVLALIIIGLVVGNVIINLRHNNEVSTNETATEDKKEMTPEQAAYYSYVDNYNMVKQKAEELLKQNPVNVNALIDLYRPHIEQYLGEKQYDRASAFIRAERDALISAGFEQQALDELLKIDYSVFNEPEQHKYYNDIIDLAKKVGNSEVVAKYEPLAAQTKEAYDKNNAASDRAAAEGEAIRQRAQRNQENENQGGGE